MLVVQTNLLWVGKYDIIRYTLCDVIKPTLSRYSCFDKGCPPKPYATMPKGIMGNGGSWSLLEV